LPSSWCGPLGKIHHIANTLGNDLIGLQINYLQRAASYPVGTFHWCGNIVVGNSIARWWAEGRRPVNDVVRIVKVEIGVSLYIDLMIRCDVYLLALASLLVLASW
jgi:hypothetical protein